MLTANYTSSQRDVTSDWRNISLFSTDITIKASAISLNDVTPDWINSSVSDLPEVMDIDGKETLPSGSVPDGCLVLLQSNDSDFVPWDNPDNLISQQTEQVMMIIVNVVCLYTLFPISVSTNVINMIVFCRQGIKERINLCLFSLSVADLGTMVTSFLLYGDHIYTVITNAVGRGPLLTFSLSNYVNGFLGFLYASGFMTMVIACQRCFCVVSPLKSQTMLTTKTMAVIIVAAFVVTVGGYFVNAVRWEVTCFYDVVTNTTSPELYLSDFYFQNERLIAILDGIIYGVLLPSLYVFVVLVSTVVTVTKLKEMTSWREKTSSVAKTTRDVSLTRMLIGTSALFIVCSVPNVAFRLVIMLVPDLGLSGRYYNTFMFMASLTQLCNYVNATVNFFIYYSMGSRYRETVKRLFKVRTKTKNTAEGNTVISYHDRI